ncbi:MAG: hypothetical protein NVS4B12_10230 [Ktedonobacteraceae bacterium]
MKTSTVPTSGEACTTRINAGLSAATGDVWILIYESKMKMPHANDAQRIPTLRLLRLFIFVFLPSMYLYTQ